MFYSAQKLSCDIVVAVLWQCVYSVRTRIASLPYNIEEEEMGRLRLPVSVTYIYNMYIYLFLYFNTSVLSLSLQRASVVRGP